METCWTAISEGGSRGSEKSELFLITLKADGIRGGVEELPAINTVGKLLVFEDSIEELLQLLLTLQYEVTV